MAESKVDLAEIGLARFDPTGQIALAPGVICTDFARATPPGRIGEPADMAGAAVLLASPAGRHISGQTLVIDGGMTAGGAL